jgi:hypothetical protein
VLFDTCSIGKMHFRVNQVRMEDADGAAGPLLAAAFDATSNSTVNDASNTSSVRASMVPI